MTDFKTVLTDTPLAKGSHDDAGQGACVMESPCVEFEGYRNKQGYGYTRHEGKMRRAHRVAWERANGLIPAGLCVLHRCDNPPCCNVAHLFLGTQKINVIDMMRKGRMNIEPAQAAARFQRIRKFSHDQIDAIRSAPGLLRDVAARGEDRSIEPAADDISVGAIAAQADAGIGPGAGVDDAVGWCDRRDRSYRRRRCRGLV